MEELYSHQWYGEKGSLKIIGSLEDGLTLEMWWKEKSLLIKQDSIQRIGDLLNLKWHDWNNIFLDSHTTIWELATELWEHVRNFSFDENTLDWTISHKILELLDNNWYANILEIK